MNRRTIAVGLFQGLLLLIGFGVFINAVGVLWQAFRTTHWPQTEGTIISSEMDSKDIPRGVGALEEKSRQYRADIAFRYQVDDETHMGDKVSVEFAPWWTKDYYKAKRILMRYPVGEDVIVYYDPNDPSNGVLDPGVSSTTLVESIIRVFIVAACFLGASFVKKIV
ncbi:MAG: DUF3592 domain-containing protein [Gammaproteobacteria bacterium]